MIENSALGMTMLRPDQNVTLTREEHHQPALAVYAPGRHGSRREIAVELASCRIVAGKYAGQRGIEARLDGERIGELTHRMSQRYLPHVDAVLARGGRPACEAVVFAGVRGIEAELRLPGTTETEPPPRGRDRPPAPPGFRAWQPQSEPPTSPMWHQQPAPHHQWIPAPPPPVPHRAPTGSRARWAWAGAGVTALLLVIGVSTSRGTPEPPVAQAPTTVAAPVPTAPVDATAPPVRAPEPVTVAPAPTRRPDPTTQSRPAPAPVPAPAPAPRAGCDPNYSGCVPIASDVDCEGGSGNGPAYVRGPVRVVGSDKYGLDSDNDGTGCDS